VISASAHHACTNYCDSAHIWPCLTCPTSGALAAPISNPSRPFRPRAAYQTTVSRIHRPLAGFDTRGYALTQLCTRAEDTDGGASRVDGECDDETYRQVLAYGCVASQAPAGQVTKGEGDKVGASDKYYARAVEDDEDDVEADEEEEKEEDGGDTLQAVVFIAPFRLVASQPSCSSFFPSLQYRFSRR
jgi:hypothetical protein